MFLMAYVIQLSGKKRHGKDTVARLLKDKLPYATILSFAEPLKQILAETLDITLEELDIRKNNDNEYRGMLQRLGTEAMKPIFGDTIWYDLLLKKIEALPINYFVIIPDWRFIEEIFPESFKVRIIRPSIPLTGDDHPSEVILDNYKSFDYTLENPEGVSELLVVVDALAEEIKTFFNYVAPKDNISIVV
jgi:hypothetical protein